MVRRHNRLLVALYVVSDAILAMWAFVLAYGIRFESGLIPVYRGYPPLEQYLNLLPFVAVLTPFAFWLQGVQWLHSALHAHLTDYSPIYYVMRLAAYALIAAAIVQKNLRRPSA